MGSNYNQQAFLSKQSFDHSAKAFDHNPDTVLPGNAAMALPSQFCGTTIEEKRLRQDHDSVSENVRTAVVPDTLRNPLLDREANVCGRIIDHNTYMKCTKVRKHM